MGSMRTRLVIITLALLACLVVIGLRPDEPPAAGTSATSQSPSFEVRVEKPLSARPLGGLFGLIPADDLAFNDASRGAAIGLVGPDRLELRAEGWDFSLEIDGEGRVAPGTRLVFPLELGGTQVTLRCRPADRGVGTLRITTPTYALDVPSSSPTHALHRSNHNARPAQRPRGAMRRAIVRSLIFRPPW